MAGSLGLLFGDENGEMEFQRGLWVLWSLRFGDGRSDGDLESRWGCSRNVRPHFGAAGGGKQYLKSLAPQRERGVDFSPEVTCAAATVEG